VATILVWVLVTLQVSNVLSDICSHSFCDCEDSEIICQGSNEEEVTVSPSTIPSLITALSFSNFSKVIIKTNTFNGQSDLKELSLRDIESVELDEHFYSSIPTEGSLRHFNLENLQKLTLASENCFENFPHAKKVDLRHVKIETLPSRGLKIKSDTFFIKNCQFGKVSRAGIFSETNSLVILDNTFDMIQTHSFSGTNNLLNFSGNTVANIDDDAFQLSAREIDISNNLFGSISGSPMLSLSPTPECIPDSAQYDYEDSSAQYRVVADTTFRFENNEFGQFNLPSLKFPGSKKVPLGGLRVSGNKIDCECSSVVDLVEFLDYDQPETNLGEFVLKNEFYSTSYCKEASNSDKTLMEFSRENIEHTEKGAVCKKRPNKKSSEDNYDKNGIDVHLNSRKGNKKSEKGDFSVAGSRVQTTAASASCNKFQLIIAFVSILFMRVSLL